MKKNINLKLMIIFIMVFTLSYKTNKYEVEKNYSSYFSSAEQLETSLLSITTDETTLYYDTLSEAIADVPDNIETTIKILKNLEIDSKTTIPANKIIIIDGCDKTITRKKNNDGTYYVENVFEITASSTVTIKNVIFDEGNNWTINEEKYQAALAASQPVTDGDAFVTPEAEKPVIKNRIFINSGTLTFDNVTFKNQYSVDKGIYQGKQDSTVTFKNTKVLHCASKNTALLSLTESKNAKVFVEEGTLIDGNYVGGNGGLFKVYSGAQLTINNGTITNTKALNSNGIVAMAFSAKITLNGGTISNTSGVRGKSNNRNSTIYIHNGGEFYMNGGIVEKNRGTTMGAIDVAGYSSSKVEFNGGELRDNICALNEKRNDLYVGSDYNLTIEEGMKINGNVFIYGNLTNNGQINGDVTLDVVNETDKKTIEGEGKINGDIVIYYDKENPPELPIDTINGNLVLCETNDQVLLKFYYNGGVDEKGLTDHGLISVDDGKTAIPPVVKKQGYHVEWYMDEELNEKWNEIALPNKSHLFAKWIPNEYKITWNVDGEKQEQIIKYGEVIIPPTLEEKEGHTFSGWSNYTENMTMPSEDIELSGNWSTNEYTITWEVFGKKTTQKIKYGEKITLPEEPTKLGYKFISWTNYEDNMTMPSKDVIFTAEFEAEEIIPETADKILKAILFLELDVVILQIIIYTLRKKETIA